MPCWERAALRATERGALAEAIRHARRGLELLEGLPDTRKVRRQELRLQLGLGGASMNFFGIGSPEVEQAVARARELSQELGETSELFGVLLGLSAIYFGRAQWRMARKVGEEFLELARSVGDPTRLLMAHAARTTTFFLLGEFAGALAELKQGMAVEQPGSPLYYGMGEWGLQAREYASRALFCLGYPDQALEMSQQALRRAEELSHPLTQAMALQAVVTNLVYRREWPQAQERAEALIDLSREHGFGFNSTFGATLQGRALAAQGRHEEGIASIRQSRAGPAYLQNLCYEGEAWLAQGTPEAGLAALGEALEHIEKSDQRSYEAEVYRVKAELLLIQAPPDAAEAEASLHRALEVARSQSAKSWELRAATSLARLWQRQGKRAEARELLQPVYDWFTEGFDTQDLKDAKALLDELA